MSAPVRGDFIRYRDKGAYAYAVMTCETAPTEHLWVDEARIPRGASINECVWKTRPDRLEVRRTYIKRVGPPTYVPKTKAEIDRDLAAVFADIDERDAELANMMTGLGKIFGF